MKTQNFLEEIVDMTSAVSSFSYIVCTVGEDEPKYSVTSSNDDQTMNIEGEFNTEIENGNIDPNNYAGEHFGLNNLAAIKQIIGVVKKEENHTVEFIPSPDGRTYIDAIKFKNSRVETDFRIITQNVANHIRYRPNNWDFEVNVKTSSLGDFLNNTSHALLGDSSLTFGCVNGALEIFFDSDISSTTRYNFQPEEINVTISKGDFSVANNEYIWDAKKVHTAINGFYKWANKREIETVTLRLNMNDAPVLQLFVDSASNSWKSSIPPKA